MSHPDFDAVLGRVPSGVFILTTISNGQSTGMLSSWVMQAGFEPPAVTVAIRQGRYVEEWIAAGRPFVLNMVREHDKKLLKHFVRGFEPEAEAFEGLETHPCPRGVPILADALGHLECQPTGGLTSGDHHIFLAEVVGGRLADHERPMVHIRKTGKHY